MAIKKNYQIDAVQDLWLGYDTDTGDIVFLSGDTIVGRVNDTGIDAATLAIDSQARGDILRRGASAWERLAAGASGQILVGDGTDIDSVAVGGDVTMDATGAVTIADPFKTRNAIISLNNDGTGVDGAIVGSAANSLGHADGVTVVPAVAGKVIDLVSVVLSFTHATADYTAGGQVSLIYKGGVDATGTIAANASFGDSADNINLLQPASGLALANTDVAIVSGSAFTDPGTAAGTATVKAHYRLVDG